MDAPALAIVVASPALAQTVVDGDTIKLKGVTWRLWGIDAPETKQWCGDYPAGALATRMLVKLMKDKTTTCEDRGTDRYGRTIGLCRVNGDDLSAAMVQLGMAWAFVRYSRDYVELERWARAENLGVHAHGCQPAWEWRRQGPLAVTQDLRGLGFSGSGAACQFTPSIVLSGALAEAGVALSSPSQVDHASSSRMAGMRGSSS